MIIYENHVLNGLMTKLEHLTFENVGQALALDASFHLAFIRLACSCTYTTGQN